MSPLLTRKRPRAIYRRLTRSGLIGKLTPPTPTPRELVAHAYADPAFAQLRQRVEDAKVQTWLKEDEKALLFGIGAFAPGTGRLVEIGSWHGSSACYLAGGIARRGQGRLTCVDPHLAGPTWLGLGPSRGTYSRFREVTEAVGVSTLIDTRVGDSVAVAAAWPAEPIDAVFIDGDHSFTGALKDFESWAPKVRPGGLVLVDDADDPALPGVLDLIELLKTVDGITWLETLDGFAIFRRDQVEAWTMLEHLRQQLFPRGIHRAWNMSALHQVPLPSNFGRSRTWTDGGLETAYELCFLARCGPGPYGYSPLSSEADRSLLRALSADRDDGEVVPLHSGDGALFRAVLCRPEEAADFASALQPGGVLIARDADTGGPERELAAHRVMEESGLDGCGWFEATHWGVRLPHRLSADAILAFAIAARAERSEAGESGRGPVRLAPEMSP
jgi:predicted O-methyltransferase YrrM